MICKQCSTEFEAERSTARYCSSKCKSAAYRNKDKGVSVTDETVSVTDNAKCDVIPKAKDFHSLPQDVQRSIMRISESDDEVRRRTAAALRYQELFPDNQHKGIDPDYKDGYIIQIDLEPAGSNVADRVGIT